MTTLIREEFIDAPADAAWDALRDFGAVHERLARGFVSDSRMEGDTRVVTFFNGAVAREVLVGVDNEARRLAYSVVESPLGLTFHLASAQVHPSGAGSCRFVWITDLLPNEAAAPVGELMALGLARIKTTLEENAST